MTDIDLTTVDESHHPEPAGASLIEGCVYCMRCCRLVAGTRGVTNAGKSACRGPARMRPLEPIYETKEY